LLGKSDGRIAKGGGDFFFIIEILFMPDQPAKLWRLLYGRI
jgi:hypothetical protein